MSPVLVVWLAVGVLTVGLLSITTVTLVRHMKVVLRTSRRLGDEVRPVLERFRGESDRVRSRLERLPGQLPTRDPGGRIRR
jgi:hypothetical protein